MVDARALNSAIAWAIAVNASRCYLERSDNLSLRARGVTWILAILESLYQAETIDVNLHSRFLLYESPTTIGIMSSNGLPSFFGL